MKRVVITGSTRGIGYGLASSMAQFGAAVMVSGRSAGAVEDAVHRMEQARSGVRVAGQACDVREPGQVQALWDAAVQAFGGVDIWINNAGVAPWSDPFQDHTDEDVAAVVGTNLAGTIHGCRVALQGMTAAGGGAIYNMEGFGSDGRMMAGLNLYGTSKAAIRHLTRALSKEAAGTNVIVCALSPGMVVTDLLLTGKTQDPATWERTKKIFNILADTPETVTPWLALRILANRRNGARIAWLTTAKVMTRFMLSPFRKRDLFAQLDPPRDEPTGPDA
jgi:NAD(P)-dependent dehydrogenase (short-subunit alcohol dehydrogenase family)